MPELGPCIGYLFSQARLTCDSPCQIGRSMTAVNDNFQASHLT